MTTQEITLPPITPRQREIWQWIADYHARERIGPSVRDVAKAFRIASPNGVMAHVRPLVKRGWLESKRNIARSIIPTLEALSHAAE